MDFHIDKKMGFLLVGTFVLGGIIGGLLGTTLGHEGRGFRDFRGRGSLSMMPAGRFGNDYGAEDGFGMVRRTNAVRVDARGQVSPVGAAQPGAASNTPQQ